MKEIVSALTAAFVSSDEETNVVDALHRLAYNANCISNAIMPDSAAPGHDATGGRVESLTEAIMGVTAGLCRIADAIFEVAEAIRASSLDCEEGRR